MNFRKEHALAAILIALVIGIWNSKPENKEENNAPPQKQPKIFVEKDFYFDKHNAPYKEIIIAGVNKVYKEHPQCTTIDPGSATISSSKGSKENPVFFVTCGSGQNAFNVWFSKSDVIQNLPVTIIKHINRDVAADNCKKALLAKVFHPSTASFDLRPEIREVPNGNTIVTHTFQAKNSFGLELKYQGRCLLSNEGLLEDPEISETKK